MFSETVFNDSFCEFREKRKMRYRSVVRYIFLVKIVFLEQGNDRAGFELIREDSSDKRKIDDVSYGR